MHIPRELTQTETEIIEATLHHAHANIQLVFILSFIQYICTYVYTYKLYIIYMHLYTVCIIIHNYDPLCACVCIILSYNIMQQSNIIYMYVIIGILFNTIYARI